MACDAQDFTQKEVLLFAIFVLSVFLLSAVDVFLTSTAHSQLHTHSCGHDFGARCTCSCSIECSCFAKRCSCNVRQSEFHTIQRSSTWENARTIHFSLKHQYVICIIIHYTCSSSACGSLMKHGIFKAFWFVVWRPPKDDMLETWKFQGGHLIYIYINNIGNCFRFFDASHMYTKKYWAQEQPVLCGFQICVLRFVFCLWLWKPKRNTHIYIYICVCVYVCSCVLWNWNLQAKMFEI